MRCARDSGRWGSSPARPFGSFPAPTRVRRFLLSYPDLATMLGDQRLLVQEQRFEGVQGAVLVAPTGGWTFRLDLTTQRTGDPPDDAALLAGLSDDRPKAQPSTLLYLDYLTRFTALEQLLRSNGQWRFPHPCLATFVGDAAVESVVGGELADLPPADLGPLGQVVLSPILREPVRSPLLGCRQIPCATPSTCSGSQRPTKPARRGGS